MGGEDWADWMHALKAADVLTENACTVAYSYIGSKITYPIYYEGTIVLLNNIFTKQLMLYVKKVLMLLSL